MSHYSTPADHRMMIYLAAAAWVIVLVAILLGVEVTKQAQGQPCSEVCEYTIR